MPEIGMPIMQRPTHLLTCKIYYTNLRSEQILTSRLSTAIVFNIRSAQSSLHGSFFFFFISETESESHYIMESMPKTRNAADVMEKEKYFASESSLCCYHVNDAALKRRPLTAMMYKCTQGRVFFREFGQHKVCIWKGLAKKGSTQFKGIQKIRVWNRKKYTEKTASIK